MREHRRRLGRCEIGKVGDDLAHMRQRRPASLLNRHERCLGILGLRGKHDSPARRRSGDLLDTALQNPVQIGGDPGPVSRHRQSRVLLALRTQLRGTDPKPSHRSVTGSQQPADAGERDRDRNHVHQHARTELRVRERLAHDIARKQRKAGHDRPPPAAGADHEGHVEHRRQPCPAPHQVPDRHPVQHRARREDRCHRHRIPARRHDRRDHQQHRQRRRPPGVRVIRVRAGHPSRRGDREHAQHEGERHVPDRDTWQAENRRPQPLRRDLLAHRILLARGHGQSLTPVVTASCSRKV